MNERIEDIAAQCRETPLSNTGEWYTEFNEVKFGELIIQKCLTEIKDMLVSKDELLYSDNDYTTDCVNERLLEVHDNIVKHFEVKL